MTGTRRLAVFVEVFGEAASPRGDNAAEFPGQSSDLYRTDAS
jgi:hypothetical protein